MKERIKDALRLNTAVLSIKYNMEVCKYDSVAFAMLETAVLRAEKAMEKQNPMKVTDIHVDDFICPSCGNESCTIDYSKVPSYCPECGQALYQEN